MKINEIVTEGKTGPGLWANIHAKRERIKNGSGEKMRKPGSKGAPTSQNFKDAASESMEQPATPDSKFNSMMSKMTSKGALDTREATAMMFDLIHEQGASYSEALQQASVSYEIDPVELKAAYQKIQGTNKQGVAEGYQLDEGAIETITALVKRIPGIGKYYQMAQQYKPHLIEILKTSKSGKEVKQKMEQLAASQSATVAESGMMKQLGGFAAGGASILSTMWMNAMGMIDGVLAHAAAGEVGGAVASGSILGLIPVTLMLFAAMLMFKGSKQSSDEKAQAFQAQRGQQGVAESIDDEDLANEVYAEFERIYPNLARKANEHSVRAAIIDVLNYGGDSNPSALAQDVARAVKRDIQQDVTESILEESYDGDEFYEAYGDLWYDEEMLNEAEYQGRKVQLGKPVRSSNGPKKFHVFVKDPSTGNVKKVNFGDKNMRIKKSDPARRKSFRARHNCANPGPRTKAKYWSCRNW